MADAPSPTGAFAVLSQASELWAKQPRRRKTLAIAVVLLVIGGVAWATLVHHGETWAVVSEAASPADTSELYGLLQARDIPVRLRDGKVEVAADRISDARAVAAGADLANGAPDMGDIDKVPLGMSSTGEEMIYHRALQGELARTITGMVQVERARVMIAFGKHSPFKDQEQAPSASVGLRLHAGQTLSAQQVQGIRELVAKSITGLKADEVVVVDQHGNILLAGDATDADKKLAIERATTLNVRHILENVVGEGKVSVVTTADFDTSRTNETEEVYDKDHPVLRSESRNVEGPNATAGIGGVAGTQGNLPGAAPAAPTTGSGAAGKLSETKNYEISRKVRQTEGPNGSLKKLHVAILIDGKTDKGARSEAELKQLTMLARTAAGLDDARGDTLELQSMAFAPLPDAAPVAAAAPDWTEQLPLPLPILAAAAGGVLLLLIAVVAVLMIRRARRRARREHEAALPIALPAPLADLERVLEARPALGLAPPAAAEAALPAGPPVQERVLAAVRSDVERAAAVLTAWLAEPPPKGAKP